MLKINKNFKKYYLNQSKKLQWVKKPKKIIKILGKNKYIWFPDGKINLYQNCVSNHLKGADKNKIAIITINEKKKIKKYSYIQIDKKVNNTANYLKNNSKKKILKIMIQASASIESAVIMLACAKIGFHFSVIFQELEELGIRNRIRLFKPDIFFTRLSKYKFTKIMHHKNQPKIKYIYNKQIKNIINLKKKSKQIGNKVNTSYQSLFTLFTSGSTGAPKGIVHTTGGYLLYAKLTCEKQFGMNKNSIVLTASDAGWINGHTYSLFGPLSFGATTILVEKPISLIDKNIFEKILDLRASIIYLPVTLIRLIKSLNKNLNIKKKYINAIGSMGEPLAPSVAKWFAKNFAKKDTGIVNTYFQTETGGIICSPRFDENTKKIPHGSVGRPFSKFIKINSLKEKMLTEIKITLPWPGMMKNVINGKHEWNKYWDKSGNFKLFDIATKKNKNIYIHGRNDDVINIRGHRIGSEEVESIILNLSQITECCAVMLDDYLEGGKIYLFVVSKVNLDNQIEKLIISAFGSYALPKKIFYVPQIPKTRSGKMLRGLLRNMLKKPKSRNYGDISTILNIKNLKEVKKIIINSYD